MTRALEHEVLEEVGEPLTVRLLMARPDVVPDVHRDDSEPGGRAHHDAQPVVESSRDRRVGDVDRHAKNLPSAQSPVRFPSITRSASARMCPREIHLCLLISTTATYCRARGDRR